MGISAFVSDDDGYTEECYFEASERMYPAVRFDFRPIRVLDRVQIVEELRDLNRKGRAKDAERYIAEEVATRIARWEFLGEDGHPVDGVPSPKKDSVLKLKPQLFVRFADVVIYGTEAGDDDPGVPEDEKGEKLNAQEELKN